ncbi:MAG: hypothetical protein M1820_009111 [Bogoriella megaspora]|nr:MAG: hypothetical protein M1820_009111 [Bogoriella megaspora]
MYKFLLSAIALAATVIAAPVDTNTTASELEARGSRNPLAPIGIDLWGEPHGDCQGLAGKRPPTFDNLQYWVPMTVHKAFVAVSMTRGLAKNEKMTFFTKDNWENPCGTELGHFDSSYPGNTCSGFDMDGAGAYCLMLQN